MRVEHADPVILPILAPELPVGLTEAITGPPLLLQPFSLLSPVVSPSFHCH